MRYAAIFICLVLLGSCKRDSKLQRTPWKLESYYFISETGYHNNRDSTFLFKGLELNFLDFGALEVKTDSYSVVGSWDQIPPPSDDSESDLPETLIYLSWETPSGQTVIIEGEEFSVTRNKMDFSTPVTGETHVDPNGHMMWRFGRAK